MFQHYILIYISHSEKPYWVIKSLRSCPSWTFWSISGKVQLILFTCSYALVPKWPLFTVLSRINLSSAVTSKSIGCGLTRPTIIELISLLWCLLLLPAYDTIYTLPIISICNWLCRIAESSSFRVLYWFVNVHPIFQKLFNKLCLTDNLNMSYHNSSCSSCPLVVLGVICCG